MTLYLLLLGALWVIIYSVVFFLHDFIISQDPMSLFLASGGITISIPVINLLLKIMEDF